MSPNGLLSHGYEAQGHELPVEGRIRLVNGHQRHLSQAQARFHGTKGRFVGDLQNDGVGAFGEVSGGALSRGMDDLRGLDPLRQIGSHNHVVADNVRMN